MIETSMMPVILDTMYPQRREMVPLFIGAPGIGKTQAIYKFAQEKGVKVVTYILSNTIPSEISGIHMPDQDTKKMEVFDDSRMLSLEDGDVLFFDEILEAPPQLWSACLTLIQDRIMASGRRLPDVFIVAASNPVVSARLIPPSVRDRFCTIELKHDFKSWQQWMMDEHGIAVADDVENMLKSDSDRMSILTPRRFTKLCLWIKSIKDIAAAKSMKEVVADEFDQFIADTVWNTARAKKSKRQQVVDALGLGGITLPDGMQSMPLGKMLEKLQSLPEWPQIEAVLAATDFDEEE